MDIFDKYKQIRPLIEDADVILFHGTGILAHVIQNCDNNAYHNHVGIIIESHGALFIVDSNESGVQADRLSKRIDKYKGGGDFTVIKPLVNRVSIDLEMKKLLNKSDDKWIKYDFINGAKELANRKFNFKFEIKLDENRDICSDYISRYMINLDLVTQEFKDKKIVFPEDYIRYLNENNALIIGLNG